MMFLCDIVCFPRLLCKKGLIKSFICYDFLAKTLVKSKYKLDFLMNARSIPLIYYI